MSDSFLNRPLPPIAWVIVWPPGIFVVIAVCYGLIDFVSPIWPFSGIVPALIFALAFLPFSGLLALFQWAASKNKDGLPKS